MSLNCSDFALVKSCGARGSAQSSCEMSAQQNYRIGPVRQSVCLDLSRMITLKVQKTEG